MTVKFAREFLHQVWDESMPLVKAHYQEIAHYQDIELKPDRDRYMAIEDAGGVRLFTVREEGRLIGYCLFLVSRHPHYMGSLQAMQDVLYLDPSLRGRLIGYRFINWCDEKLKADGVQVVMQHTKDTHNFGPMLERMGYEIMYHVFARRLN